MHIIFRYLSGSASINIFKIFQMDLPEIFPTHFPSTFLMSYSGIIHKNVLGIFHCNVPVLFSRNKPKTSSWKHSNVGGHLPAFQNFSVEYAQSSDGGFNFFELIGKGLFTFIDTVHKIIINALMPTLTKVLDQN